MDTNNPPGQEGVNSSSPQNSTTIPSDPNQGVQQVTPPINPMSVDNKPLAEVSAPVPAQDPVSSMTTPEVSPSEPPPPPPSVVPSGSDQTPPPPGGHKPNMLILSLVVLFVGVLTGVSLYAAGAFRGNTLRMGEFTSVEPTESMKTHREKIIVGTDATYPPMEFMDATGNMVGYDIDLANEIGKEMGADIEFKNIAFDDIFTSLETKQIDAVISSVTITDERKDKYNFSEPYINAGQVMVTLRDAGDSQMTTDSLKGKRVGVQKGTTSEEEALKYTERNLVISYVDYPQAVVALESKKIDVIIVDLTAAKGLIDENPSLRISSDPFTNEYYGIAMRKEDTYLKEEIDKVILSLQKRGILVNIKQKWFQ